MLSEFFRSTTRGGTTLLKHVGKAILRYAPPATSRLLKYLPDSVLTLAAPQLLVIEPTNRCNLKCPLCSRTVMKRSVGSMSLNDYKTIIDQLPPSVHTIELFFVGEPLLHKDICDMVAYSKSKGIKSRISTNSTTLYKDYKKIVDSKLDELIVVLDGATKKTHEEYRVGSNFEKTLEGIKKICEYKKKKKHGPEIILQVVIMKHNEKEVPQLLKMADDFGVDHLVFKSVHLGTWDINKRVRMAKEYLPKDTKYRRYDFKSAQLVTRKKQICYWMWCSVILWNGDVTVCCFDYDGEYKVGNIFKDGGFMALYKSQKYKKLRKKILLQQLALCEKCSYNIEGNARIF